MITVSSSSEYGMAQQACVLFENPTKGIVELRGRDRADLLHRITTNDVNSLAPGTGQRTLWLNRQGRIVTILTLYARPESLLVTTEPGQTEVVLKLLDESIFFGDELQVENRSPELTCWYLYGPKSTEVLNRLGAAIPDNAQISSHWTSVIKEAECLVAIEPPIYGGGIALIVPKHLEGAVRTALTSEQVGTIHVDTHQVLRIEHGYPDFGKDLSENVIPLEAGLQEWISFSKGCYVGQEVITRMHTRDRLAKRLCGFRLSASSPCPAHLLADGKDAGMLTSAAISPDHGIIGLGYIRSEWSQPGQILDIAQTKSSAEVVFLPFVS